MKRPKATKHQCSSIFSDFQTLSVVLSLKLTNEDIKLIILLKLLQLLTNISHTVNCNLLGLVSACFLFNVSIEWTCRPVRRCDSLVSFWFTSTTNRNDIWSIRFMTQTVFVKFIVVFGLSWNLKEKRWRWWRLTDLKNLRVTGNVDNENVTKRRGFKRV